MDIADEVVSLVLRDVAASSPVQLRVDPTPLDLAADEQGVRLSAGGGTSVGVVVNTGQSFQERLLVAADVIQDWLVEILADQGRSAVWPVCPEHPDTHPLTAAAAGRSAIWKCPRSGSVAAEIGSLGDLP
jgi:hypothetical protein